MKNALSVLALVAMGAAVASAGAYAAQGDALPPGYFKTAVIGPALGMANADTQRDVIEPPSSIDPGMALDPPQTGARMPIVQPPGAPPAGRLVLPH